MLFLVMRLHSQRRRFQMRRGGLATLQDARFRDASEQDLWRILSFLHFEISVVCLLSCLDLPLVFVTELCLAAQPAVRRGRTLFGHRHRIGSSASFEFSKSLSFANYYLFACLR